ncbi:MAG TPA: alpha-L-arabinofuranosidase C-terminal domain-containing protein [Acidobacteriaceae bacterium]|jgi:alpha-N-arabinofuranosidase
MKKTREAALLSALLLAIAGAQAQQPATLEIDAQRPIAHVSPTLYGLMTEEINHSYDGGLYPELIRDRAFMDDSYGPHGWVLVEQGSAQASIALDKTTGPSAAIPRSLKITIQTADAKNQAGVANTGYWGMAVRADENYQCSFYAKADGGFAGPLTARLVSDRTGAVLAHASVPAITGDWQQYKLALKTGAVPAVTAENHFELVATHPGNLYLSLVSVFPPTYHNREDGLRADLMEKLADMRPKFLRLPGGNYLEGDHISERFEWKKTIGPWVDRPTHVSPWGYHSSDGMGLLEFLEWCEDLKIQPVLAVYAGYSLRGEHVEPGSALEPYVQDALDEIEYVTGGANTKWGAERAKDGHPAPFPLTYVEIGNEDWFDRSNSYDGRYAQFYKAIKGRYPQLQLIATAPVKSVKPDVLDDHFYRSATEFFNDTHHYDKTDRSGPKIFVGEWATREGAPTPNMGAALGDAAWMTGMERNSDIVIMASYAPLLTNINPGALQWETDLIGYDAVHSYGSPSYYAQVIFAGHLGDEVLSAQATSAGPRFFVSTTRDSASGTIHLKLVNASSVPQALRIHLNGVTDVSRQAELTTLRGSTPEDTNSITDPERILPIVSTIHTAAADFEHTMPPYSIQVLDIQAK